MISFTYLDVCERRVDACWLWSFTVGKELLLVLVCSL